MREVANSIFISGLSKHRIIRAEAVRLPKDNGDRDITEDFSAPGVSTSGGPPSRPFLSYQVKPGEQGPVRLKISLNGTNVVDQTLSDPVGRTFNGVIEHGVLEPEGNELRVFVPSDPPGSVVVSNLILRYCAAEEIALPDPDAYVPSSGSGF